MIRDLIKNLPLRERVTIKSVEFAKLSAIPKLQRANGFIEVSKSIEIKGGIRVYVRAWDKDNNPIGFGKDGTIETEKLNIINPPILVIDPLGDIDLSWTDSKGELHERRAREDVQESLLLCVEKLVSGLGKPGTNIIKGSIGNTSSQVFATGDGESRRNATDESWATIRAAAGSTSLTSNWNIEYSGGAADNTWDRATVSKGQFDTSVVGSDTVDSVDFFLYLVQKSAAEDTVKAYSASSSALSATTYTDHLTDMATAYVTTGLSNSGMTVNNYYSMAFNATGKAAING